MPGKRPSKPELARMKALSDMGESNRSIARQLGKGHGTVKRYLNSDVFNDPDIDKMVERIKETETTDLYMLGVKARRNLHVLADAGKMRPIENIALLDRVFQQRRLLEGKSSVNIGLKTQLVIAANRNIAAGGRPKDGAAPEQDGEEGA